MKTAGRAGLVLVGLTAWWSGGLLAGAVADQLELDQDHAARSFDACAPNAAPHIRKTAAVDGCEHSNRQGLGGEAGRRRGTAAPGYMRDPHADAHPTFRVEIRGLTGDPPGILQWPDSVVEMRMEWWPAPPGQYEVMAQAGWDRGALADWELPVPDSVRWYVFNSSVLIPPPDSAGTPYRGQVVFLLPVVVGDTLFFRGVVRGVDAGGGVTAWTDSGVQRLYVPPAVRPDSVAIDFLLEDSPLLGGWGR